MTDEEDFSVNLASIEIPFNINRELFNELSFSFSFATSRRITVYLMFRCH